MTANTEHLPSPSNPLQIMGIEFIEFSTAQPLVLGALLCQLGFVGTARHRSREIVLYQQGNINIVVNASPSLTGQPAPAHPVIAAIALRVGNAAKAHAGACQLGAWDIPTRASAMELNIPGIHGPGESLIYFVDRFKENMGSSHTIYDVDFVPLDASPVIIPPALVADLHFFGVVQAVQAERTDEWVDFYHHLLGFNIVADASHGGFSGVLRKGVVLQSPCKTFHIQLIEPPSGAEEIVWDERFIRIGLGTQHIKALTLALQTRGIVFLDSGAVKPSELGAVTQSYLGSVTFELVHSAGV